MCPVKKPIKIAVINEDDEVDSKPKPKARKKTVAAVTKASKTKKARTKTTKKTVIKKEKTKTSPATSKAAKKRVVTEAIDTENKDVLNNNEDTFAEKLKKELSETIDQDNKEFKEASNNNSLNLSNQQTIVQGNKIKSSENIDQEIQEIVKIKSRNNRSVNIYRRIAYFFIFLVFLLLITSAYFLLTKVTIVLISDQERMSNNLIFDVQDSESDFNASRTNIKGIVRSIKIEHKKAYPASGSEVIGKEAVGEAEIINNYSKSQMLVATTRLISANGDLFRLKNTVNVPAGGRVKVEIYADKPGPEMAIDPTKFSIPGLWAGLQDKIYAESKEKVVYQQKIKKHIVQDDIDNGIRDMKQQLLVRAKSEIGKIYNDYDEIIYNIDDDSIKSTIDAEAGDELDEVEISMSADVIVIAFGSEESSALAEQKFISSLPDNKELIMFDKENIIYSLNNYNSSDGIATINATFEGKVSLKENSVIIDKEKIIGLNQKQLEIYLDDISDISGFDIKFYPSFLPEFLKKVPRLPERIEIKVKK